jgi:hypothetical protein
MDVTGSGLDPVECTDINGTDSLGMVVVVVEVVLLLMLIMI